MSVRKTFLSEGSFRFVDNFSWCIDVRSMGIDIKHSDMFALIAVKLFCLFLTNEFCDGSVCILCRFSQIRREMLIIWSDGEKASIF